MAAARLTTKDLQEAFGVTPMTIYNWRQGTPTRDPLPAEAKGRSVFYRPARVKAWASRHGIKPVRPLGDDATAHSKPGPKPAARAEKDEPS